MEKKVWISIVATIAACVLIAGGIYVFKVTFPSGFYSSAVEEATETDATEIEAAVEENVQEEPVVVMPEIQYTNDIVDIAALQEENPDIYAYLKVPGTTIDYPILQSEEDDYYLNVCVDGTEGYPGSIYTNKVDGQNFARYNTIVYGHNMKDKSYFGQLHLFEDKDFFDENRYINVYLDNRKLTYEIVAASSFTNDYLPDVYNFDFSIDAGNFINDLIAYAPDNDSTNVVENYTYDDSELITLSTCIAGDAEERYMVVGRFYSVEMYEDQQGE